MSYDVADTCVKVNLPGWTPSPGVQLVKDKEKDQYDFVDTKENRVIYRFCLIPYQVGKHDTKPAMRLDVTESGLCRDVQMLRQFPYAAFFRYLLARYTLVLQHRRQPTPVYAFWFRRLSWALLNGYTLLLVDRKKGRCLIKEWPEFFNEWLGFCRGRLLRSPEDTVFMIQAVE